MHQAVGCMICVAFNGGENALHNNDRSQHESTIAEEKIGDQNFLSQNIYF